MNTTRLIDILNQLGVTLVRDGDKLKCRVPKSVASNSLREAINKRKRDLLAVLEAREAGFHLVEIQHSLDYMKLTPEEKSMLDNQGWLLKGPLDEGEEYRIYDNPTKH